MNRSVVLMSACAVLAFAMVAAADEDSVEKKLTAAREEFEKTSAKARAGLLADLKKKEEAAQKAGDLKTLETVQAEFKAFEADGTLPKLVSVNSYVGQLRTTRARLEESYSAAVKQYTKDGKIVLAKSVQKELDEFKKTGEGKVDSRKHWVHEKGEFTRAKGDEWEEKSPTGKTFRYKEVSRTKEYVELDALDGDMRLRYRLYDDRADIGKKTESTFKTMFSKGKWAR